LLDDVAICGVLRSVAGPAAGAIVTAAAQPLVLVVHAVDTEGPLYESLDATFGRLRDLYGVDGLPRTRETLERLKRREIPLGGGLEEQVARTLNGHLLNYMDTWDKLDAMLARAMSPAVRNRVPDSFGGGWVFNWHCLDHVGFETNPRRRDMGYHNIFDHYAALLARQPGTRDALHFHFHPMSTYRDAHRCATSFVNSPHLYEILCRRVIERRWFPTVFRAGFQTERPDSHWFLEQWIPFDLSNMAIDDPTEFDRSIDFRNGRSGDWRRAPADWSVYQPSHDDYQTPGQCRRWIGRALNVLNRIASIDQREVDKAFARAASGKPALMAIATHDFRDLSTEVEHVTALIADAVKRFPGVRFRYCEAVEAFRRAIGYGEAEGEPLELDVALNRAPTDDAPNLVIETRRGRVFGPQPFLAIETRGRRFIHDNLDFDPAGNRWHYAFHADTLPLDDVRHIGVAANDRYGNRSVKVIAVVDAV
jgi:hypothetical protein